MIGRDVWDISPLYEGKPPKPNIELRCPFCGGRFYFRYAKPFRRMRDEYRVDVSVKCEKCSSVFIFGIHITLEEFNKIRYIDYRHVGHVLL